MNQFLLMFLLSLAVRAQDCPIGPIHPLRGQNGIITDPYVWFEWPEDECEYWIFQLSTSAQYFESNLVADFITDLNIVQLDLLEQDMQYWWRIYYWRPNRATSEWTDLWRFSTCPDSVYFVNTHRSIQTVVRTLK